VHQCGTDMLQEDESLNNMFSHNCDSTPTASCNISPQAKVERAVFKPLQDGYRARGLKSG